MNRIKRGTDNRMIRITAFLMAVLLCAGMPQAALTGRASNALGSQGSTISEGGEGQEAPAEGAADGEVDAIIAENDEGAATSTVTEVKMNTSGGVNVRSEASASSTKVAGLENGVVIGVVGETTGSDGNTWYQISGQVDGKQVDGYVRSDLVEVTATAQPEPEAPADVPADTPADVPADTSAPSSNDYEVAYAMDDTTGANDWFLNDNINGNRYKISELLGAAQTNENNIDVMEKQTKSLRTIIIILAVIIGLLVVVVTIMIFKLRNSYEYDGGGDYDDYGDDEEDDDDEDEDDDDEDDEDEEDYRPGRRQSQVRGGQRRNTGRRYDRGYDEDEEDEDEEDEDDDDDRYSGRPSRRESSGKSSAQPTRARSPRGSRARNFLDVEEDDEMDFEFLDLK